MGHGGYSVQRAPGYSGFVGMERPSSFSPPGRFPLPGQLQPPARNGMSVPFGGHEFSGGRYPYRPQYPNRYPHRDPYHDHDHDHHDGNHHVHGYAYAYPGFFGYPYPYVIDPGFYDWSTSNDYENQQGANAYEPAGQTGGDYAEASNPEYGAVPYNQQENAPPASDAASAQIQEYHFAGPSAAPSQTSEPLKVIFKDNRAPMTIQNYMVNSTSLTDLDRNHYEQIPLDQIDIAATQKANRAHGVFFEVPSGPRN